MKELLEEGGWQRKKKELKRNLGRKVVGREGRKKKGARKKCGKEGGRPGEGKKKRGKNEVSE